MNKRCVNCGTVVDYNVRFCPNCGNTGFIVDSNEQSGVSNYQAVNNNKYQSNSQEWQSPTTQNKKKKKTKSAAGVIVCLLACLLVSVTVRYATDDFFPLSGYSRVSNNQSGSSNFNVKTVEYTKGSFDGSTYINKWADIRLVVPSNYYELDGSSYEDSYTDCGLFVTSDESNSVIIMYQKLPDATIDEKSCLDYLMDEIDSSDDLGAFYTSNDYTTTIVGGHKFTCAKVDLIIDGINGVQNYLVRKVDGRMIVIVLTGSSQSIIDNLARMVESVD